MDNYTDMNSGISSEEAKKRAANGESNVGFDVKTKSVGRIFRENIFTLFNLVNAILAALVAAVGSYRNMLFMGVIICNIAIGIIQEIRSKRVIDRLSLISAPQARLVRDGNEITAPVSEIVMGDVMILSSGQQVCADGIVLCGECEADESLVTGESDPVPKKAGDELISGSFIVAGGVRAQAIRVGAESFSGKIANSSKSVRKPSSQMMRDINKIISVVSVCIVPFGLILFFKAFFVTKQSLENGVVSTVAALIGMIPEGLVLLTSVALAVSTIRLARRQTLCQDLYCVESLARTDVLCLDKTGTITEGVMELAEIIPLDGDFDTDKALNAFAAVFPERNPTLGAICENYTAGTELKCVETVPFSSARKLSAAEFEDYGTIALGAPNFVLEEESAANLAPVIREYTGRGLRVLLLAHSSESIADDELPKDFSPKALIVLSDKIRESAPQTMEYFKKQGVAVKVISGDDPITAANAAKNAGLDNYDKFVDVSALSDSEVKEAAEKYTVFGRVTPDRKLALVKALKAAGHKVAMTGDGVNDVPALREADCSIAMQSGSDAARSVSQLVLMNSDFSSMPLVVEEGRRCINNIQRSASLFLVKTIFSFLLAVVFLILPFSYPFKPIQMTLISAITIGIPSFLLALEPNHNLVKGRFIENVLKKSAPGGISVTIGIGLLMAAQSFMELPQEQTSTIAVYVTAAVCFGVLFETCRPFDAKRGAMFIALAAMFAAAVVFAGEVFYMCALNTVEVALTSAIVGIVWLCLFGLENFADWLDKRRKS
jgi:cation-transporting ATPase E